MGGNKDMIDEHDALVRVARRLAVKSGRLAQCEPHGIVYDNDPGADSIAFAYATNALKSGEVVADHRAFMDAMKEAIRDVPFDCTQCEIEADA